MSAAYSRAADAADALRLGAEVGATFLAGGVDLMQLWKSEIRAPGRIVDISRLPLDGIEAREGGVSLGALARLSDVAAHPATPRLVALAIAASASGQLRNMATVGGNLLQATRCVYFRGRGLACNKRAPGSGCGAREGHSRQAALFGASPACIATHASDLAVALAALDAELILLEAGGERRLSLDDFYRLPGEHPHIETNLEPGGLVAAALVPPFSGQATYLKIRDRASFEFAVVSVAAALRLESGMVVEARLAAGGVAPRPWRLRAAEARLIGRPAGPETFAAAGQAAVEDAMPLAGNAFKVPLLRNAIVRALQIVGGPA